MCDNYRPTQWVEFPTEEQCLEARERLPIWHPDRSVYDQTYLDRYAHIAEVCAANGDMDGYRKHKADYAAWSRKRAERLSKK